MTTITAQGWRTLLAWWLITQQLGIGLGIPLPKVVAAADSAERYPCEQCGCGCATAAACWRDCCCFTHTQKVAWAQQHDVPVPAFVVTAAAHEAKTVNTPTCPHCADRAKPSPEKSLTAANTCCEKERNPLHERPTSGKWLSALRCGGLTGHNVLAGPNWPGEHSDHAPVRPQLVKTINPPALVRYHFLPPAPPTPPPRLSAIRTTAPDVQS